MACSGNIVFIRRHAITITKHNEGSRKGERKKKLFSHKLLCNHGVNYRHFNNIILHAECDGGRLIWICLLVQRFDIDFNYLVGIEVVVVADLQRRDDDGWVLRVGRVIRLLGIECSSSRSECICG